MVGEFRRIIVNNGKMSHNADLKDHLGGALNNLGSALNNLRFSDCLWESEFMVKSGFYTNRLQHQDILNLLPF